MGIKESILSVSLDDLSFFVADRCNHVSAPQLWPRRAVLQLNALPRYTHTFNQTTHSTMHHHAQMNYSDIRSSGAKDCLYPLYYRNTLQLGALGLFNWELSDCNEKALSRVEGMEFSYQQRNNPLVLNTL